MRTVGFHICANRNEPLRTQGLTGPVTVTNILSQINAATYNAAHVGTDKNPTAAVDPVVGVSATARASPFINDWVRLFVVVTSHATQVRRQIGKQTLNAT